MLHNTITVFFFYKTISTKPFKIVIDFNPHQRGIKMALCPSICNPNCIMIHGTFCKHAGFG